MSIIKRGKPVSSMTCSIAAIGAEKILKLAQKATSKKNVWRNS